MIRRLRKGDRPDRAGWWSIWLREELLGFLQTTNSSTGILNLGPVNLHDPFFDRCCFQFEPELKEKLTEPPSGPTASRPEPPERS